MTKGLQRHWRAGAVDPGADRHERAMHRVRCQKRYIGGEAKAELREDAGIRPEKRVGIVGRILAKLFGKAA